MTQLPYLYKKKNRKNTQKIRFWRFQKKYFSPLDPGSSYRANIFKIQMGNFIFCLQRALLFVYIVYEFFVILTKASCFGLVSAKRVLM